MALSKLTVTGKVGPGNTATATVLTNVSNWNVDNTKNLLTVFCDQGSPLTFDIDAATTMTVTISAKVMTISIS